MTPWPGSPGKLAAARRRDRDLPGGHVLRKPHTTMVLSWPEATGRRLALPAPLAPLGQVRVLGAEGGVAAMPREDPGRVGQPIEHLRLHAVEQ